MTDTERNETLTQVIMWLHPQYKDYDKAVRLLFDNLIISVDKETDDKNYELIKETIINDITVQLVTPTVDRYNSIVNYINERIRKGLPAFSNPIIETNKL